MNTERQKLNCDGFFEKINLHFQFLKKEYDFEVTHSSSKKHGEYCLFIYESPHCQIRFMHDKGTVQVDVGGKDAPKSWPQSSLDKGKWYPLRVVIDFIYNELPKTEEEISAEGHELFNMTIEENLTDLSQKLKPVINKVNSLFDESSAYRSKHELDAYLGI